MNSFIPVEDMPAFQKFLSDNNLQSKQQQTGGGKPLPPPSIAPPPPGMPRPPGAGGGEEGGAPTDVDRFFLDLDKENDDILTTNF